MVRKFAAANYFYIFYLFFIARIVFNNSMTQTKIHSSTLLNAIKLTQEH